MKLSKAAIQMLQSAEFTEIADDCLVVGNTDICILLCNRAVADLNRQARERVADGLLIVEGDTR
ncbi:hypothetical protein [Burkholderia gladioli]|uniref:hypothetical protein n=1 Tax=Burkholderia gladioli TaxID=28095 RepID=UPI0013DDDCD6|nr:hypothetical protein [Burkholderia gladioli]